MSRYISKAALALGAVLAVGGAASAGDRDTPAPAGGAPSTTMTLGGKGTLSQAATEDTELARGYYGYYGYRGGYGYGGYRGGYYGGYYGGYRGYYGGYGYYNSFYRPYYGGFYGSYYRPAYYGGFYSYPVYSGCYSTGIFIGIGGGGVQLPATDAPASALKADPISMSPVVATTTRNVSLKDAPAAAPYKYKAYGEK